MSKYSSLSALRSRRAREAVRRRHVRALNLESLEPRLALATGALGTLVSVVDDAGHDLLAASSAVKGAAVVEGRVIAASVTLTRQPSAPVRVSLVSTDTSEVGVGDALWALNHGSLPNYFPVVGSSLTFTPANWNIPQPLTIRSLEDGVADGARQLPLRMTVATAGRTPLAREIWVNSFDSGAVCPAIVASGTYKGSLEAAASRGSVTAVHGANAGTATFRVTSSQLVNVRERVISIDYAIDSANKVVVRTVRGFNPAGVTPALTYRLGGDGIPVLSGTLKLAQPSLGRQATIGVSAALVAPGMKRLDGYAPATDRKAAVGGAPEGIAIGPDGTAWVANPSLDAVQRLVRVKGVWAVTDTVPVGKGAAHVAVAPDGSAWVATTSDDTVRRIVRQDGVWTASAATPVAAAPAAILAAGDGAVWIASGGAGVVQRIATVGGSLFVSATLPVAPGPASLALGRDGAIWVASKTAGTVQRIASERGTWVVGAPIAVGSAPASISAAVDGSLWVANTGSNSLQRIVARGGVWRAQSPVHIGRGIVAVAAHQDGSVWVTHAAGGTIQRIAPTKGLPTTNPIAVLGSGTRISALAIAPDGSLLATDPQSGTVTAVAAAPGDVQDLAVTPTGVGSLLLSWNPSAGGATGYTVTMTATTSSIVSGIPTTTTTTTSSTTTSTSMPFTGLAANAFYTFSVVATNAAGSGPAATTSFGAQTVSVGNSPVAFTKGLDGSIWVANKLGSNPTNVAGTVQQLVKRNGIWTAQPAIEVGRGPIGLATAPDGSIWVANSGSLSGSGTTASWIDTTIQQIVNHDGVWSAQPAITVADRPNSLSIGLDGSVWWTPGRTGPSTVQQVVERDGVWTTQPPIDVGASPMGITTGLDGSLWVANFHGDSVQQIMNDRGVWTAQPAIGLGADSFPFAIVTGMDGSIWVSIGKDTGSGVQQLVKQDGAWVPRQPIGLDWDVTALTVGPDGSLWATCLANPDDSSAVSVVQQIVNDDGVWTAQPAIDVPHLATDIAIADDGSIFVAMPVYEGPSYQVKGGGAGPIGGGGFVTPDTWWPTTMPSTTLQQVVAAPSPPYGLAASIGPGPGEMTLAWHAASANGSRVVSYTVTASQGTTTQSITTSSTSCTLTGLTLGHGTTYFTVTASNFAGTSQVAGLLIGPDGKPLPTTDTGVGIVTDGTPFTGGGFDGHGNAYSWQALGSSSTLAWNGVTFDLGSPNQPDFAIAHGQTVTVPQGDYTTLNLAGAAVTGSQTNQQITLTFTDGSTVVWTQSFSDWGTPQNYGHEAIISTQSYLDTASGGTVQSTNHVYGYSYTIPTGKTLASITLPKNADVRILDIEMSTATSVDLSSAYTSWGIANGSTQVANHQGFDGGGNYYYSAQLGPLVAWSGATFDFGAVPTSSKGTKNFVQANGQAISLPQGNFSWLYLAAAGANGGQPNQTLTLTFTDDSTATWTQSFSDWCSSSAYAGETIIQEQSSRVNQVGNVHSQTNYVYGYAFQIPAGKTLKRITLPDNTNNLGILGIAMM